MLSFILMNIEKIGLALLGIFGFLLYGKNNKLKKENAKLNSNLDIQIETNEIQKKVINAVKNTKRKSLAGNRKRMRNKKL